VVEDVVVVEAAVLCVTDVTRLAISPASVPTAMSVRIAETVEVIAADVVVGEEEVVAATASATDAMALVTLLANVLRPRVVMEVVEVVGWMNVGVDVEEAGEEIMEVVLNATSVIGLVILLVTVRRKKIVVTDATELDTLPGTANRRRIPATTVTRLDIL